MLSDFTGRTGQLYALYRRDLPDEQAAALAAALGLTAGGTVVDLGCGTGQLAVPLRRHCQLVLGLDPEPEMLHGMRARRVGGVVPVLADDADLPLVAGLLREAPQAVVIGNALHWYVLAGFGVAAADRVGLRVRLGQQDGRRGAEVFAGDGG